MPHKHDHRRYDGGEATDGKPRQRIFTYPAHKPGRPQAHRQMQANQQAQRYECQGICLPHAGYVSRLMHSIQPLKNAFRPAYVFGPIRSGCYNDFVNAEISIINELTWDLISIYEQIDV